MHILVADDEKDDFDFLEEAAEQNGQKDTFTHASNWLELLRCLQRKMPDALFLDLNMPVKNGLECLQLLRSDPKYRQLPIFIYTTSGSRRDIDQTFQSGASYFIMKPHDFEGIKEILKIIIGMSKEALVKAPSREAYIIML